MERLFQKPPFCLIAGGGFPFTHSEVYHIHTSLCNLIHSSVGIYTTHSAVYIYKVTKSLIYKYNKNLIFDFLIFSSESPSIRHADTRFPTQSASLLENVGERHS